MKTLQNLIGGRGQDSRDEAFHQVIGPTRPASTHTALAAGA